MENDKFTELSTKVMTPHKYGKLVLSASKRDNDWECEVDCPFVFAYEGKYGMTYVGFDGIGYQTGLAFSDDLIHWRKKGVVINRILDMPYLENSIALTWILRENDLYSKGELKKVNGKYIGVYLAMPEKGYEAGPGVIGVCRSSDLLHWDIEAPFLYPEEGKEWEQGGLYKACLIEEEGTYYLFYNAKNKTESESAETTAQAFQKVFTWKEQIGIVFSKDLKNWKRYEGNPILKNGGDWSADERVIGDACVLKDDERWYLFNYCIDRAGGTCDRVAVGEDLFHFHKCPEQLISQGKSGEFDDVMACKPSVISKEGVLYHFYTATSSNGGNGITFATSKRIDD